MAWLGLIQIAAEEGDFAQGFVSGGEGWVILSTEKPGFIDRCGEP